MKSNKKIPDRVSIEKADKHLYDDLVDNKQSPFYKRELLDIYLCALALGYRRNLRKGLKKKEGLIRLRTIENNEEAMWLIRAIAISEGSPDTIANLKEVVKIAEEYANGGIKPLYEIIFKSEAGDPIKHLESEAIRIVTAKKVK